MYKVIAAGKQRLPQQATCLRQQLEQLNENVKLTSLSALAIQFLHSRSRAALERERSVLPEITGLAGYAQVQHL